MPTSASRCRIKALLEGTQCSLALVLVKRYTFIIAEKQTGSQTEFSRR